MLDNSIPAASVLVFLEVETVDIILVTLFAFFDIFSGRLDSFDNSLLM